MLRWSLLLVFVLALAAPALAQPAVTPICDLKVDANADCVVDTPPVNDPVVVEGIVLAWKQYGARGAGAIHDPVSGCCISVFDITNEPDLAAGTLVRITGWVGNFAGLLEIVDDPGTGTDPVVEVLGNAPLPPMKYPEVSQLADFSPWAEENESCLMSICGSFNTVDTDFVGNTNYEFVGVGGGVGTVRIDLDTDLVGQPVPQGIVQVTGILGQFNNFTDTCIGYQLLPRSIGDITPGDCAAVPTKEQSWGSIKSGFGDK